MMSLLAAIGKFLGSAKKDINGVQVFHIRIEDQDVPHVFLEQKIHQMSVKLFQRKKVIIHSLIICIRSGIPSRTVYLILRIFLYFRIKEVGGDVKKAMSGKL